MAPAIISGDINQLNPDAFRAALRASGITQIDTAARYMNGESEKIIGAARLPQDFLIDTKILLRSNADPFLSPKAIEESLSHSLRVLGIGSVNTLYAHGPDHITPIPEQIKAFDEQYRKRRYRHLGVCNFSPEMVQEYHDAAEDGYVRPRVYQGQYNLLCRAHEDNLFPLLRRLKMSYAAFSPLAGGFLLGNFTAEGVQGGNRFAQGTPFTKWYDHPSMHEAIKKLEAVSERTGLGMDELSLRWLRYHSALTHEDVIIMGGSKTSHIESGVRKASNGPLPDDVAKELDALWDGVKEDGAAIVDYSKKVV